MSSNLRKCGLALGVVSIMMAPSTATAVSTPKSYQGADYSTNSTSGTVVYACDLEDDNHDDSADFVRAGSSSESHVVDAYDNGCSSTGTSTVVYKHRAVELLPLTDAYGPWVFPS